MYRRLIERQAQFQGRHYIVLRLGWIGVDRTAQINNYYMLICNLQSNVSDRNNKNSLQITTVCTIYNGI